MSKLNFENYKVENPTGILANIKQMGTELGVPVLSGILSAEGVAQVIPTAIDLAFGKPESKAYKEAYKKLLDWGSKENKEFLQQAGVPRPGFFRFRRRPEPAVPRVGLLRAVPRDQLRFRQPPDGTGRHLLLLPP